MKLLTLIHTKSSGLLLITDLIKQIKLNQVYLFLMCHSY